MGDFIDNLEKNANVFLEWCRQQRELPEEERGTLEFRVDDKWYPVMDEFVPWHHDEYRLRKRLKKHTATVYWYRNGDGTVRPSLAKPEYQWPGSVLLGTTTDEFTESQE